jgi:phenylpropionate dioxygenase-like ring-hydroxylating dioxygenase large terminal subunit
LASNNSAARIRIVGYPVHEYCGLIFAYMGEGTAPEPVLDALPGAERSGTSAEAAESAALQ